jgi:hypothetical protein
MSWNQTVTCGYCYNQGHNKRSCEQLKKYVEENPDSWTATKETRRKERQKTRTCGYCDTAGHNRATCANRKSHMHRAIRVNKEWCSRMVSHLKSMGIATGTLVQTPGDWRNDHTPQLAMIVGFNWMEASFLNASNTYCGDFLQVKKVGELKNRFASEFRLPHTGCEVGDPLQDGDSNASGRARLHSIASRITDGGNSLDALLPDNFLQGEYGIREHFKDDKYHAPLAAIEALEKEYFPNG